MIWKVFDILQGTQVTFGDLVEINNTLSSQNLEEKRYKERAKIDTFFLVSPSQNIFSPSSSTTTSSLQSYSSYSISTSSLSLYSSKMKFTLPIAASLALVLSSSSPSAVVEASPSMEPRNSANFGLTSSNCYGAPTKPWKSSAAPGWWLGTPCKKSLPQWDGGDFNLCNQWWSGFLPICYARQTPSNFNFCNQWWSSSIPFCRANNGGTNPITSKPCTTTSTSATSTSTTSAAGSTPTSGTGTGSGTVCSDGYKQSFSNYTTVAQSGVYQGQVVGAATIDNANYLTCES